MTDSSSRPAAPDGATASSAGARTPWRSFLRTETGSAAVLLVAVVAALAWANIGGYEGFWSIEFALRIGSHGVALGLREWVNSGLMALFFFVVGLEARREFDMGELRERPRIVLSVAAGLAGMAVPVGIYLAFNASGAAAGGWGAAMSTDTAFALGMLALLGRRLPTGLRTFVLSIAVVDDLIALVVIAVAYSEDIRLHALVVALGIFVVILLIRATGTERGVAYAIPAVAAWFALLESGIDPVVIGLAVGLLTLAYPAARGDLERASGLFRRFREQPTPEFERSARLGLAAAISPNERLRRLLHPWSSYVIVPLFALANAGITLSGQALGHAFTSPVTLGILFGFLVGKPVGITVASWLAVRIGGGRLRPPVGWGAITAGGSIAGVGFTVSLLIATLAFHGDRLEEAKIGTLSALICSSALTWLVTAVLNALPRRRRARALLGTAQALIDLAVPVDPERDKIRGPLDAPVTVVEYADFECPYCGLAEPVIRELLADFGDVRYVFRHLPLTDVHPFAQLAAEAAEAAAEQGAFWEMHDLLLAHQDDLRPADLMAYAERIGLDLDRFRAHLRAHRGTDRIAEDVDSADLSGVSGTPTFFINGRRHNGAYDIAHLSAAARAARVRVGLSRT